MANAKKDEKKTKKKVDIKKRIILALGGVIVCCALICAIYYFGILGVEHGKGYRDSTKVAENGDKSGVTVIDENATFQTMNGFGASACWWAQEVGGWSNRREIIDKLYNQELGIGLNIYRYNLGAGSKDDEHIYLERSRTECFLDSDGTYDYSADANAQRCLNLAQKTCDDPLRVSLFCNSAPSAITKNNLTYCSAPETEDAPWESNLDKKNYELFADYCYNCTKFFIDKGYRVTSVSPINEPQYDWRAWWNDDEHNSFSFKQEGCYYSKKEARDVYKAVVNKFNKADLPKTVKVSMFESGAPEGEGTTCTAYLDCIVGRGVKYATANKALRNHFDTIEMHSYWASQNDRYQLAKYLDEKYPSYNYAVTEYCQMSNDGNSGVYKLIEADPGTSGLTIEYGTAMANIIVQDLTLLNAVEWDWWTACAPQGYCDGLIYIDYDNHENIEYSKRYFCLGNFSKFIDEGAVRIDCSDGIDGVDSVAFVNRDNTTVIVYVNTKDKAFTTKFNAENDYSVYTTDATHDLEKTAEGEAGEVDIEIPAQSVVSFVMK